MEKNQRRIEVYKAVLRLKRASAEQVLTYILDHSKDSQNIEAVRRAVQRDLKILTETHNIGVDYYKPNGEEIPPGEEENYKNYRLEYYALDSNSRIPRMSLLQDLGAQIISSNYLESILKVYPSESEVPSNHYFLSIEFTYGHFLTIAFSKEERPLQILFSRQPDSPSGNEFLHLVKSEVKGRQIYLFLPNKSLSRFKTQNLLPHATLSYEREIDTIHAVDHNSSKGTHVCQSSFEDIRILISNWNKDKTAERDLSSLSWKKAQPKIENKLPACLKVGNNIIYLGSK